MKGFSSRLDRLIHLRSREEAERARELRDALRRAEEADGIRRQAEAHLERCQGQVSDQAAEASPAGLLQNLRRAVDTVMRVADAALSSEQQSQEQVRLSRDEFGQARQGRRVLERLRERAHESWKVETDRQEQSQCDEVVRQHWKKQEEP